MNPRLAGLALVAFIAVLAFVGWMITTRRARTSGLIASQRRQIDAYHRILDEIHGIARGALDVDPSAALIDLTITQFKQKALL